LGGIVVTQVFENPNPIIIKPSRIQCIDDPQVDDQGIERFDPEFPEVVVTLSPPIYDFPIAGWSDQSHLRVRVWLWLSVL
jgi:hypothetical protein